MTESITCPECGMTSYHPEDVRQGYCGNCHDFTGTAEYRQRKALLETLNQRTTADDPRVQMLSDASSLVGYLEAYADPIPGSRPLTADQIKPLLAKARRIRDHLREELAT